MQKILAGVPFHWIASTTTVPEKRLQGPMAKELMQWSLEVKSTVMEGMLTARLG